MEGPSHERPARAHSDRAGSVVTADEDVCRVCRSEGSDEDPLFYPCKCSGSIRYVHQDCLMEWLSHSKKKHCELCKTPFKFTKVYEPDMPRMLPLRHFSRTLLRDARVYTLLVLRWVLVAFVWLGWLPYCTRHIWNGSIRLADGWTFLLTLANLMPLRLPASTLHANASGNATQASNRTAAVSNTFIPSPLNNLTTSSHVNRVLADVFEGQVITSIIIVIFVVVFLIREWIVQNNADMLAEAGEFAAPVQPADPGQAHAEPVRHHADAIANHEDLARNHENAQRNHENAVRHRDALLNQRYQLVRQHEEATQYRDQLEEDLRRHTSRKDHAELALHEAGAMQQYQDIIRKQQDLQGRQEALRQRLTDLSLADPLGLALGDGIIVKAEDDYVAAIQALQSHLARPIAQDTWRQMQQNPNSAPPVREIGDALTNSSAAHVSSAEDLSLPDRASAIDIQLRILVAAQAILTDAFDTIAEQLDSRSKKQSNLTSAEERAYRRAAFLRQAEKRLLEDSKAKAPAVLFEGTGSTVESENGSSAQPLQAAVQDPLNFERALSERFSDVDQARHRAARERSAERKAWDARREAAGDGQFDEKYPDSPMPEPVDRSEEQEGLAASSGLRHESIPLLDDEADHASRDQGVRDAGEDAHEMVNHPEQAHHNYQLDTNEMRDLQAAANMPAPLRADGEGALDEGANAPAVEPAEAPLPPQDDDVADFEIMPGDEVDEDIEGLLELIGVRGPIVALLQNSMLVVVLISTFIFFGVSVPGVIGRWTILVARNPWLYLIETPRQLIEFGYAQTAIAFRLLLSGGSVLFRPLMPYSASLRVSDRILIILHRFISWIIQVIRPVIAKITASPSAYSKVSAVASGYTAQTLEFLSPGGELQALSSRMRDATPHRAVSIVSGYATVGFIGALYLHFNRRLSSSEQGRQVEVMVRAMLRQAGYVVKFAVILGIELAVFPLYCGVLLDLLLLSLFKDASIVDRINWLVNYPVTTIFLHWFSGTIYMFHFALFISMCRRVVRPGLLFFVRDPDDPEFNPIKDILERPIRSQMRKIGLSVFIYGVLIMAGVGSVVAAVRRCAPGLLPLHWTFTQPVLAVPIDAVFLEWLVPVVLQYFAIDRHFQSLWKVWFTYSARKLRLSSFVMGHRVIEEEDRVRQGDTYRVTGSFRRVPQNDSIPLRKHQQPMILNVTEDNVLLDQVAGQADETREDPNYTVVYVPPLFRLRLYLFLLSAWAFGAMLGLLTCILPLLFGRKITNSISPDVHNDDVTAWLYGSFALVIAFSFLSGLTRIGSSLPMLPQVWRQPAEAGRKVAEALKFTIKWLYLISSIGVAIPFAISLCIKAYISSPLAFWSQPDWVPTIYILHDWLLGLVYVGIIARIALLLPESGVATIIYAIGRNDWLQGWRNPQIGIATRGLIAPALGASLLALLAPAASSFLVSRTLKMFERHVRAEILLRMSYPVATSALGLFFAIDLGQYAWRSYRQRIRDHVYLKGSLLHNYRAMEPPAVTMEHAQGLTVLPGQTLD